MIATGTVHAEPRQYIESPSFRVNFWLWQPIGQAWALDAFVLTEVRDVREVLDWAEARAQGQPFEVFAELGAEAVGSFQTPRTAELVRLYGSSPVGGVSRDIEFHQL